MPSSQQEATLPNEEHAQHNISVISRIQVCTPTSRELDDLSKKILHVISSWKAFLTVHIVSSWKAFLLFLQKVQETSLRVTSWLQGHSTFYRLHLLYFILMSSIGTFILWLSPKSISEPVSFIDALYNATSALCVTGLSSIKVETFSYYDDMLLMSLMILGSPIFTSLVPVYVRQYHYKKILKVNDLRACEHNQLSSPPSNDDCSNNMKEKQKGKDGAMVGDEMNKVQTAGVEYDAMLALSRVVVIYFFLIHIVSLIIVEICVLCSPHVLGILKVKNVPHVMFAIFITVSLFANAGFSPLNENLIPFQSSPVLLLWLLVLILVGNTMFAPCLRFIIWILHKYAKGRKKLAYQYLLQHPRRCYTHLFPHDQTIWLVLTVLAFNTCECLFFFFLDWRSVALQGLRSAYKMVVGVFQSVSTRNAGANVVNLADLSPSMLVLYIGMMYVAAYPVFLSRQTTKLIENDLQHTLHEQQENSNVAQIAVQARNLLARDSAYLFLSIFLICLIENHHIRNDSENYSIFNIIFEVISAYGNVGLSVGYSCKLLKSGSPCEDVPYSFSGKWNYFGKVIIVIVMFLGRHRGLPEDIDVAVGLPHQRQYRDRRVTI